MSCILTGQRLLPGNIQGGGHTPAERFSRARRRRCALGRCPVTTPPAARWEPSSSRAFADDLVARMTLPEKAGQMAQVDRGAITPSEVAEFAVGSVLSGGGGNPEPNTPSSWRAMVGEFVDAARRSRLGIPLLYGVDAVHGHANVVGATVFPHHIGLGATGDAALVEAVYRATALEAAATGVRWDFAPTLAVSIDPRWGRCYESFSDDPELVAALGVAAIRGLMGAGVDRPDSVLACAKHFVGDGATTWGSASRAPWTDWWNGWGSQWHIDQGEVSLDEADLRATHLRPYVDAIAAGALTVMASYNSWHGEKLHGHRRLLTEVLKEELGFEGFVVSDWMGIDQLDADPYRSVVMAIDAGIDMVMVPFDFERFIGDVVAAVDSGDLAATRVDDAVRRIITVKHAMGLFRDDPLPGPPVDVIGSDEHRRLARRTAAASAVLLEHRGETLPIISGPILLAGAGADDIGLQCGGWTVEWQGAPGPITPGTTILTGLRDAGLGVEFDPQGEFAAEKSAPVGIVVVAERPYAEGLGDRGDLTLPAEDAALIARVRPRVDRLVLVVLSGRPLVLGASADLCDAIVAAWLPGTEGSGVADVLTGTRPFVGRLPRHWPADSGSAAAPAWPRGHGLSQ
jgi:beta-glucosidase